MFAVRAKFSPDSSFEEHGWDLTGQSFFLFVGTLSADFGGKHIAAIELYGDAGSGAARKALYTNDTAGALHANIFPKRREHEMKSDRSTFPGIKLCVKKCAFGAQIAQDRQSILTMQGWTAY